VIVIMGTGEMGMALTGALVRGGVPVTLGSRDPGRVRAPVAVLRVDVAIAAADIVILAVPHAQARELCPRLAGKLVIDPTTPWGDEIPSSSGSEELAGLLPHDATLVGAWKTTFAVELEAASRGDVLVCGDDAATKAIVAGLIGRTGFRALDCGGLAQARVVEGMCRMMGPIARSIGADVPAFRFATGGLSSQRGPSGTGP
jgi:predicted dinucleotide-binding enzyme